MSEHIMYSLPKKAGEKKILGQLTKSAISFESAKIIECSDDLVVLITKNVQESLKLKKEIQSFTKRKIHIFFDWETLPFDIFSPNRDIISSRLSLLYKLPKLQKTLLIISINAFLQKVCPHKYLSNEVSVIKKNMHISYNMLINMLKDKGYTLVNQVIQYGEFSAINNVIECFFIGNNLPYRLCFLNNKIFSINSFDINTRELIKNIKSITFMPAHEFPINQNGKNLFFYHWKKNFHTDPKKDVIFQQVKQGFFSLGIEYWQPFFFKDKLETIFDYLPKHTLILYSENIKKYILFFWKKIKKRYFHFYKNKERLLIQPNKLWIDSDFFFLNLKKWPQIKFKKKIISKNIHSTNLKYYCLPDISISVDNNKKNYKKLANFLKSFLGSIIFFTKNKSNLQKLSELLIIFNINIRKINTLNILKKIKCLKNKKKYFGVINFYDRGFIDEDRNIAFISENDIKVNYQIDNNQDLDKKNHLDITINNLSDLKINQIIVHFEHGIGRYKGLKTIEHAGVQGEYVILEYAEKVKLYVPVAYLHLISRYTGFSEKNVTLHKLGADNWNKVKSKAIKKINDTAAMLLDVYANRKAKKGFSFKINIELYDLFCNDFPFTITSDQKQVINSVLYDMSKPVPMDRLVCGDVGFGKTEVAMRAAFLAVCNNKQVVVLVPTTLLAQQHFNNFKERFFNFSYNIIMLSRFCDPKTLSLGIRDAQNGKINILIGTHIILFKKIKLKNLGLLIVDEEHRFGVRDKEKIKAMCSNIDILTLTATPIPRTLNMAISGIRDMSVITTPPDKRLTVKTFVREYEDSLVKEAIFREILRGGQVFYVFNEVKKIDIKAKKIIKLVPEANVAVAHGQMCIHDLKKIMNDFFQKKINVLVCTTIIETGIDIPNANTIIIEQADCFGLAQLHQLRGRVGRSCYQAYAWFLISDFKKITLDAKKRLDAIISLKDFGSGLTLAMQDLDIRGVGEILGDDQSGHVKNIGFSLYTELLQHAVKNIKNKKQLSLEDTIKNQPEVELHISALIPAEYISNINFRLSYYKKMAVVKNIQELIDIEHELEHKFGSIPHETKNLVILSKIKLIAKKIGIQRVESNKTKSIICFFEKNIIDTVFLLKILEKELKQWKFEKPYRLIFKYKFHSCYLRIKWILNFIEKLDLIK
ncbi:transcription-repair coupling factor [Buchnera aphidicola]|uniref:transcription-repair coupling factor n=1 Tax=Buchnera aphidicola TaxID=9 RepID=UPI0034645C9A